MNSRDNMRNGIFSAQGSKDSAVLFVAGDNKMKDHTNRTNTIRRAHNMFMALLIALTMMISSAVPGVSAFAANNNDTVRVATYDQLQEALEETKGVKEIVVDPQAAVDEGEVVYSVEGDENNNAFYIGFDEALTVSDDITITSADDVDVYFARSDSFKNDQEKPALLNIESEGNLNLDGLITMTGEEVATAFYEANEVNPAEFVFSVKSKDGTGEDNEVWNSDQALKGGFYIQNNGGEYTLGDDVVMKDINLADDVEDAEQIHEEKAASSNEEEVVVEKSADAAENADSEEVAGVWEEKEEEATEEAPVVSAPKRSLMSLKSAPMMKSPGATTPVISTLEQLKKAATDGGTYIVKGDITMDAQIAIAKDLELIGEEGSVIRRGIGEGYVGNYPMFKVIEGKKLTLGGQLKLSGIPGKSYYTKKSGKYDLSGNQLDGDVAGLLTLDSSEEPTSFLVPEPTNGDGLTGNVVNVVSLNRAQAWDHSHQGKKGQWKTQFLRQMYRGSTREEQISNMPNSQKNYADMIVIRNQKDPSYVLFKDGNSYKAGKLVNDGTTWYIADNRNKSFWFSKADIQSGNPGFAWKKETQDDSCSWDEFVNYFGKGLPKPYTYDGAWKDGDVRSGTESEGPKAFFVQVENGTLEIADNVQITEYTTVSEGDKIPKNHAPIVVNGSNNNAKLKMTGGSISGNTVGYGAKEEADFQKSIQDLGGLIRDTDPTNTAGGVIFTGSKAVGEFSGSAKIQKNRADAGALIITDGASVTMKDSDKTANTEKEKEGRSPYDYGLEFKENIGWHHSGAVLVEDGGTFTMEDGSINNNVAWWKGGAVWATEYGTNGLVQWDKYPTSMKPGVTKHDKGGNFVMNGGELHENFANARAGAVEVESDGVTLNGGYITDNKSKSLGGAIYIEGDSPIYSYTLNINKGYIVDNKAWPASAYQPLDQKLEDGVLKNGDRYSNSKGGIHRDGDWADWGAKHSGDGGGVWLCAMGGTSVFTSSKGNDNTNKIVITDNQATPGDETAQNNGWGDDFYVSHRHGSALVQNLLGNWADDDGNPEATIDQNGRIIKGPKGLQNTTSKEDLGNPGGIQIIGNEARNGGGIACNGTVVLGEASDVYRYETEFDITKDWEYPELAKEVTLKLYYEYDANEDGKISDDEVYPLYHEVGDTKTQYAVSLGTETEDYKPDGNEVIYKTGKDTAKAFIPASVKHKKADGSEIVVPLYKIKNHIKGQTTKIYSAGDDYLNLNDDDAVKALFEAVNNHGSKDVELEIEWNVVIKEDGNEFAQALGKGSAKVTNKLANSEQLIDPVTKKPVKVGKISVYFSTITFGQTLKNNLKRTNFKISKVDPSGKEIKKTAEFKLFEAKPAEAKPSHWMIADVNKGSTFEVDKDTGILELTNLKYEHTYLLFETKAPEGFKRAIKPWLVKVDADGKVTVWRERLDRGHVVSGTEVNKFSVNYNYMDDPNLSRYEWPGDWYNPKWGGAFAAAQVEKLMNEPLKVKLTKMGVSGEETTPINGAKFALYKSGISKDNLYYEIKEGASALDENIQSKTVAGSNGVIEFQVPEPGHYFLFETQAPEGHIRQVEPWLIHVDNGGKVVTYKYINSEGDKWVGGGHSEEDIPNTHDGVKTGISNSWRGWKRGWYDGESHVVTDNKIENFKRYDLPSAGGMGTYWFMVIGTMMMTFAVTTLVTRRKNKKRYN